MRPLRLIYYKDKKGNFGDDLNPWLWERILPGILDKEADELLFGVGTILERWFVNDAIAAAPRKVVLGSGGGMEYPPLRLDPSWDIFGVRGPLTAQYLSLDADKALTDPAMCLNFLWPRRSASHRQGVGFIPHHNTVDNWDWEAICLSAGVKLISPRLPYLEVFKEIDALEKVITEAMHGAIIADAMRVPWRAARVNAYNYTGKWDDWGSTVRMPVHFLPVPSLLDPVRLATRNERPRVLLKTLFGRGATKSSSKDREWAIMCLKTAAEGSQFYLSEDQHLQRAISRFMDAVQKLTRSRE